MTRQSRQAMGGATHAAGDAGGNGSANNRFVINLCVLPAPITVPQPRASRLTRFSFFLSHCWEGGRRQFQLQMGYFANAAEADKWLATLKRVYPTAFVSVAPDLQPDLLSSTQALKVLNLGPVD